MNFELNRSKFSFNLSLKVNLKIRSVNLGNFSVSGGELNFPYGHQADRRALLKLFSCEACVSVFYVFCSHRERIQNCTLNRDAVKIFITDCPLTVKRNSFPSAGNSALRGSKFEFQTRLSDLTMIPSPKSMVSHRVVPFFALLDRHRNHIADGTLFDG